MTRHPNASTYAHANLTDTHTHSLPGHKRSSDQEEITPHKSNTQVTAEVVEIRVSSINSSGFHKY